MTDKVPDSLVNRMKAAESRVDEVISSIEDICWEILEDRYDAVQGINADTEQSLLMVYIRDGEVTAEDLRWIGRRTGFRKVMGRNFDLRKDTDVIKI